MANLNLRGIDEELKKRLKVGAASSGKTLREYCEVVLRFGFWCADGGARWPGVTEIRLESMGRDEKKNPGVPSTGLSMGSMLGEAERIGERRRNPKREGKLGELVGTSGVGAEFHGVADLWTKEVVDARGFGGENSGLPGPGFAPAGGNSDFPGTDKAVYGIEPDPGFGVTPPEKIMQKLADPQILNASEKQGARAAGIERVDAQLTAKRQKVSGKIIVEYKDGVALSKKIVKVAPSPVPDPVFSQKGKNVETQSAGPQTKKIGKEDSPAAKEGNPPQPESETASGHREQTYPARVPGGVDHDPKTCRMYGCLMCKIAKGEK